MLAKSQKSQRYEKKLRFLVHLLLEDQSENEQFFFLVIYYVQIMCIKCLILPSSLENCWKHCNMIKRLNWA